MKVPFSGLQSAGYSLEAGEGGGGGASPFWTFPKSFCGATPSLHLEAKRESQ